MSEVRTRVEPTTLAGYTEAITRALEAAGADPVAVLRQAHVARVRSNDPMLRITDSDINAIYEQAVAATGDAYFGLRVAGYILPGVVRTGVTWPSFRPGDHAPATVRCKPRTGPAQ